MTPEQIADLRRQKYNATVARLVKIHSDLLIMRVRPDYTLHLHKPGQYAALGLGYWEPRFPGSAEEDLMEADLTKLARRSYSISCSVLDDEGRLLDRDKADWLEFYIVLVRETEKTLPPALTPRLFLLREGERLFLGEKISGNFTLDPVRPEDAVSSWPPARARRRTTICCGSCCDAGIAAAFSRPAACVIAETSVITPFTTS